MIDDADRTLEIREWRLTLPQLQEEHREVETALVREALIETGWNVQRAAELLGVPYEVLIRNMFRWYPSLRSDLKKMQSKQRSK